jgi:hypothetical protein
MFRAATSLDLPKRRQGGGHIYAALLTHGQMLSRRLARTHRHSPAERELQTLAHLAAGLSDD